VVKIFEVTNGDSLYYHGSYEPLKVGTILTPRKNYELNWADTDFYWPLEKHRLNNMLSHKQSVFMVSDPDDVDLAGGATDYLLTAKPLGPIQKHDLNWSSEISMLMDQGYDIDSDQVEDAALNYWNGVPHYNESVWEFLTTKAEVVAVEEY